MKTLALLVILLSGCAAQEPATTEPCSAGDTVRWCGCDDVWEWVSIQQCVRGTWGVCDCGNARMVSRERRDVRDAGNRPPF